MPNTHRIRFVFAAAAVMLVLTACGSDDADTAARASADEPPPTTEVVATTSPTTVPDPSPTTAVAGPPPQDYAGFLAQQPACGAAAPDLSSPVTFAAPEDQGLEPDATVTATMTTSCGEITIELDPRVAPETVNSFVFLARAGYFDGSVSHRVVPGFVIQAGDQTATGTAGPGYTIPDELPEAGYVYERGTLAMANSGPNSTGSQFFIVLADAPLNPDFSVFGHVTDGFETLDRIASLPLGPTRFGELSVPLETLFIESVEVAG